MTLTYGTLLDPSLALFVGGLCVAVWIIWGRD
jgi:hypothetical protein